MTTSCHHYQQGACTIVSRWCKQTSVNFLGGYTEHLAAQLGVPIRCQTNRPMLYLSREELPWTSQVDEITGGHRVPYWIVCAGTKSDFTTKQWPVEYYQEVVDRTSHKWQWVQIGESSHNHPALTGVIDLRGKTDTRQLIRLVYHARGGLGPVTFLQHLCAAFRKPYICLLGGREPITWVQYPLQHTLHTLGLLDCCRHQACWKSRVTALGDNPQLDGSLCELPVLSGSKPVGRCMQMITPEHVVAVLGHVR